MIRQAILIVLLFNISNNLAYLFDDDNVSLMDNEETPLNDDNYDDSYDATPVPIVFYHGMGDTAYGSINMVKEFLEQHIDGVYVTSIAMGNIQEDLVSGFFMNLNQQVEKACNIIQSDPKLANGFHAVGFSQGGQILRAIVQRCNVKMLNLISLGGQHQGVYGLPRCPGEKHHFCDLMRKLLNYGAYTRFVQENLVQAEYWHDSMQEEEYRTKSIFLADINNEVVKNETYKERILTLSNFVMVEFLNDSIVDPRESELFGFYKPGQAKEVFSLQESPLYQEDWLGLKQLDSEGKLHLLSVVGDHLQIDMDWFLTQIVNKYLK